jgi:hypothetical protein
MPGRVTDRGFLPRVEGVDQVEPGPRHIDTGVALALGKCGLDNSQALVEGEPSRPGMTEKHRLLFNRRVETVAERDVPGHVDRSVARSTDKPGPV